MANLIAYIRLNQRFYNLLFLATVMAVGLILPVQARDGVAKVMPLPAKTFAPLQPPVTTSLKPLQIQNQANTDTAINKGSRNLKGSPAESVAELERRQLAEKMAAEAFVQQMKPMMPFLEAVETHLYEAPVKDKNLPERLDGLQIALFGEKRHQQVSELMNALATLFPEDAGKYLPKPGELERFVATQDALASNSKKTTATHHKVKADKNGKALAFKNGLPTSQNSGQNTGFSSDFNRFMNQEQNQQLSAANNASSNWGTRLSDDEFFNDRADRPQYNDRRNGSGFGEGIKALGQGLANLAVTAGSVAGNYYLNRDAYKRQQRLDNQWWDRHGDDVLSNRYSSPYGSYANYGYGPYYNTPYNSGYYGGYQPYPYSNYGSNYGTINRYSPYYNRYTQPYFPNGLNGYSPGYSYNLGYNPL